MATISLPGANFNWYNGQGSSWSATGSSDAHHFYLGGSSNRYRPKLVMTGLKAAVGSSFTKLVIEVTFDDDTTTQYMRAFLSTTNSSNSDSTNITNILATSYIYADANKSTRLNASTKYASGKKGYFVFSGNFSVSDTMCVYLLPYSTGYGESSANKDNTSYGGTWFRSRNTTSYISITFTYNTNVTLTIQAADTGTASITGRNGSTLSGFGPQTNYTAKGTFTQGSKAYVRYVAVNGYHFRYYTSVNADGSLETSYDPKNQTQYDDYFVMSRNRTIKLYTEPSTYTVTYDANNGKGTMSPSTVTYNSSFTTRKNTFTRVGYTFNGWNEKADGSGTPWSLSSAGVYESGKSWTWTYTNNITLYAQWKIETYTISYDKNGYPTTGSFPSSQTKTYGTSITLSSIKPTISSATVTGFTVTLDPTGGTCSTSSLTSQRLEKRTFKSWNTNASGAGDSYSAGATYSSNRSATLYLTVNKTYTNYSVTLPTPTREGHDFLGWAVSKTATSGTTGTYTPSSNVTLYAIWKIKTYTISYNANGGKGAPASQTKTHGVNIKLSTTIPTRDKVVDQSKTVTVTFNANGGTCSTTSLQGVAYTVYSFRFWNLGNNMHLDPGQICSIDDNLSLSAVWISSTSRSSVSLPVASKDEYIFLGWSTDQTADNIISGTYTPSADITLYAIYKKDTPKLNCYSVYFGSQNTKFILGEDNYSFVDGQ